MISLARLLRLAGSALLVAVPLTGPSAASAQPAAALDPARWQKAREISRIIYPSDLAVAAAMKGTDDHFVSALLRRPDMAAMEAGHPGVVKAVYQGVRPIFVEIERARAAKGQEALANLYAAEMSVDELDQTFRYFSSPTGRKLVQGMLNPAALEGMMENVVADPQAKITADQVLKNRAEARIGIAEQMTSEDLEISAEFMRTPAGAKVRGFGDRMQALSLELSNAPAAPEDRERVDRAMREAAEKFMKSAGK